MGNLGNRFIIKSVSSGETETMWILLINSTFKGSESFKNFDCRAFKNQTVTFEKAI